MQDVTETEDQSAQEPFSVFLSLSVSLSLSRSNGNTRTALVQLVALEALSGCLVLTLRDCALSLLFDDLIAPFCLQLYLFL